MRTSFMGGVLAKGGACVAILALLVWVGCRGSAVTEAGLDACRLRAELQSISRRSWDENSPLWLTRDKQFAALYENAASMLGAMCVVMDEESDAGVRSVAIHVAYGLPIHMYVIWIDWACERYERGSMPMSELRLIAFPEPSWTTVVEKNGSHHDIKKVLDRVAASLPSAAGDVREVVSGARWRETLQAIEEGAMRPMRDW